MGVGVRGETLGVGQPWSNLATLSVNVIESLVNTDIPQSLSYTHTVYTYCNNWDSHWLTVYHKDRGIVCGLCTSQAGIAVIMMETDWGALARTNNLLDIIDINVKMHETRRLVLDCMRVNGVSVQKPDSLTATG